MSIASPTHTVAAVLTTAGTEVTACCLGERDAVTVTCAACGPVDDIDFGPFERRCPDLEAAVDAATAVTAEHAAACTKRIRATSGA